MVYKTYFIYEYIAYKSYYVLYTTYYVYIHIHNSIYEDYG